MIEKVKIFVHNYKSNKEGRSEWEKKISSAEIVDGSEFYS